MAGPDWTAIIADVPMLGAVIYLVYWLITKGMPAQTKTFTAALDKVVAAFESDKDKANALFREELASLRELFIEELKRK